MPLQYLNGVVKFWGDVADKVGNEIEYGLNQANQFIESNVPSPIVNTLDAVAETAQFGFSKSPVGYLDQGASTAGEAVTEATNIPVLGMATGFLLGMVDGSPGSIRIKRPGSRNWYPTQDEFDVIQPERIRAKRDELDFYTERLENITAANPGIKKSVLRADPRTGYKSAERKRTEAMAAVSSEESNIFAPTPDNQYAYPSKEARAKRIKFETKQTNDALGRQMQQLEMHHLFPKGMSAAIYNRIRDFIEAGDASLSDLKRISTRMKEITGVDTGDLESDIKAMRTTPHNRFHTEMRFQPSNTFPGESLEISKEALATQLRKIKNMRDLEELLEEFLVNDIKPLIDTAKIWEDADDVIKSFSPKYTGNALQAESTKYRPKK